MPTDKTWVLVAEQSRARLFEWSRDTLTELDDFLHPAGRQRNRDLNADKHGRAFDPGGGHARHAMQSQDDPQRTEAKAFARQLIDRLEHGRGTNAFQKLILVAPPRFLGLLRGAAGDGLKSAIARSIEKNLVQSDTGVLLHALNELPDR